MKKLFKTSIRCLLVPWLLLAAALPGRAQMTPNQIYDAQLRQLFSTIAPMTSSPRFLYDMSSHIVDSSFFQTIVNDTNWVDNWTRLYDEMYHAAYDTSTITPINTLLTQLNVTQTNDTIRVALMDYDYALLKPDALTTNTYFDFDTVNDVLSDKAGAPSPYTRQRLFSGTTLEQVAPFANTTFRIDPALLFRDPGKQYDGKKIELIIDFGDGTGWHVYHTSFVQYYQANYPSSGRKTIRYALRSSGIILAYNLSTIFISTGSAAPTPTVKITTIPGVDAEVYGPPSTCNPNAETKYVIYMEGLDILNEEDASMIYQRAILNKEMQQLKNFGYTFVVINWQNAHESIATHADQLIAVINYLKTLNQPLRMVPQPFVVVGESMGGVVGRYALCKMENSNPANWGYQGVPHNTRLLITIDAPHQGANIPMSIQTLYKYVTQLSGLAYSPIANLFLNKYLHLLNAPAAKELLSEHVDTDPYTVLPVSNSSYGPHPARTQMLNALAAMGNYPRYCKKVAISDGSWTGSTGRQRRHWDNAPRAANDYILNADASVVLRVLGIKIVGTSARLVLRTNPAGSGPIFQSQIGISHWKIKLKWFGVKLKWWTDYVVGISKTATNLKPYCTMPGSWAVKSGPLVGGGNSFNSFNFFSIFGYQVSNTNGNISVSAYAGVPFLANVNFSFSAYSDGAGFGFIPTRSSFDYQTNVPLDYAFIQDPVGTTMSRTPFDVVYTNPTQTNWSHMLFYNTDLSQSYTTCGELLSQTPPVSGVVLLRKKLLNLELGDQELYLENIRTFYQKRIEVERVLHVNRRNPYYNYPSGNSTVFGFAPPTGGFNPATQATVLSKENTADFTASGNATQLADAYGLDVSTTQPPLGPYVAVATTVSNCCRDIQYRLLQPSTEAAGASAGTLLSVFPNPAGRAGATVRYQLAAADPATLRIVDAAGRLIYQGTLPDEDPSLLCQQPLPMERLTPGLYFVEVRNSTSRMTTKISIQP